MVVMDLDFGLMLARLFRDAELGLAASDTEGVLSSALLLPP
jgi:hypothetical protein